MGDEDSKSGVLQPVEEERQCAADGKPYTLHEFQTFYGERVAAQKWDSAAIHRAAEGRSNGYETSEPAAAVNTPLTDKLPIATATVTAPPLHPPRREEAAPSAGGYETSESAAAANTLLTDTPPPPPPMAQSTSPTASNIPVTAPLHLHRDRKKLHDQRRSTLC